MALHYPYRERTERVIALSRVVLALFSFLAIWLDQTQPSRYSTAAYSLLGGYLLYAAVVGAMAWRMHRPLRGFQIATHVTDIAVFVVIMYFTEGATSPFFVYFVFALVVATLRWRTRGAIITAGASLVAFLAFGLLTERALHEPEFQLNRFVIRAVYLGIVTVLLTQFERFEQAVRTELERLANWRRSSPTDIATLLQSSLPESAEIIGARRALLVWDEPEEPWRFVAYAGPSGVELTRKPPDAFGTLVAPDLVDVAFICFAEPEVVVLVKDGKMRSIQGEGIDAALRSEFSITDFVSVPLAGREFRGRLFFLEHPAAVADSLFMAEIIASELLARMGAVRTLNELRNTAVLDQRMRTALELHDGLLQSLTAAGLEVGTVARELPPDLAKMRAKLRHAEELISGERRELRALIDEMRPGRTGLRPFDLGSRLADLQQTLPQQWGLRVKINAEAGTLARCSAGERGLAKDVYFLAHEGLVNAARHARASLAEVTLSTSDRTLHMSITDDGQGFPVHGRYTLDELESLGVEPVVLSRRIRFLGGDLVLHSSKKGSQIEIDLPGVMV